MQKRWRSIKFAELQNSSDVLRLFGGKAREREKEETLLNHKQHDLLVYENEKHSPNYNTNT